MRSCSTAMNNADNKIMVSVIIPVFEVEPYIKTCLNSIRAQTISSDLDVILVLKQGRDRSCQIAEMFAQENNWRIFTVENDERQGDSRNLGLKYAIGQYISFVDSDDYVPPKAYEIMVRALQNTNADFALGRTLRFNSKNKYGWSTPKFEPGNIFSASKVIRWKDYPDLIYNGAPWNKLFTRKFLSENALTFPSKVLYEDVGFVLHAMLCDPKIAIVPEIVYKWRIRDKSSIISVTQDKGTISNLQDRLCVYKELDKKFEQYDPPIELKKAWNERKCNDILYYVPSFIYGTWYYKDIFKEIAYLFLKDINTVVFKKFSLSDRIMLLCIRKNLFTILDWGGVFIIGYQKVKNKLKKNKLIKKIGTFLSKIKKNILHPIIKFVCAPFIFTFLEPYKILKKKRLVHTIMPSTGIFYPLCRVLFSVRFDWFLYEGVSGRQYAGNEKYIYLRLREEYPLAKHIWVFQSQEGLERNKRELKGATFVIRGSLKYLYYLARSGSLFTGTSFPIYFYKRKGTLYMQSWHGTPLKHLGFDITHPLAQRLNRNSVENVMYREAKKWDYFIAPNEFTANIFPRAYKYSGAVLKSGYPRNDIFYWPEKRRSDIIEKVRQSLNIPVENKIALYTPTYRDGTRFGKAEDTINFHLDFDLLLQRLSDKNWTVIVRGHLLSGGRCDVTNCMSVIRTALVDEYDDPQELCLAADLLITDYSSIFFDYANTQRPMIFFCPDFDFYLEQCRGVYFDPKVKCPGPFATTTEEVIDLMIGLDKWQYEYDMIYKNFVKEFCSWEDGNASSRVVSEVRKFHKGKIKS